MTASLYLGTHMSNWLGSEEVPRDVSLFVSHRRLDGGNDGPRRRLPRSRVHWALDSGGFSELQMYGEWRTTPQEYVAAVRRYDEEIGMLGWAAPQDWMCEPIIIDGGQAGPIRFAGTHLSVAEHQRRTVANFAELSELWGDEATNPFMPTLQGFVRDDYLRCWDMYVAAGVDLGNYPVVCLGSVCRRQATGEIGDIVSALRELDVGLPLHGFGVKMLGLRRYGYMLETADSLAWSYDARRSAPLPGHSHKNCANCLTYALQWRERALAAVAAPVQLDLFAAA